MIYDMKRTLPLVLALSLSAVAVGQSTDHSFLSIDEVPNSLRVLDAPPTERSARFAYDQYRYFWGRALRETPRGQMAYEDCDSSPRGICRAFSGAMGVTLGEEQTPEIYNLLRFVCDDAGWYGTDHAKNHYMRTRPFVYFGEGTCQPADEEALAKNGSYPSGHTAGGYAAALLLCEINPDNQDTLLRRGMAIGESRVICGYHWQSDVDAGMLVAAGVVARLHASDAFAAQMARAKQEFARLRRAGKVKHVSVQAR